MHRNYRLLAFFALIAICLSFSSITQPTQAAPLPPGSYDPNFGTNGIVAIDFGDVGDYAYDMLIYADGRILVVGKAWNGLNDDIAIARLNPDGTLDTTFNTTGKVKTDLNGSEGANSVALDSLNRIVIGGYTDKNGRYEAVVLRYNPDGTLDTTFANNGVWHTDLSGQARANTIHEIALTTEDKIIAAGWVSYLKTGNYSAGTYSVVTRLNTDGTIDMTFGTKIDSFGRSGVGSVTAAVDSNSRVLLGTGRYVVRLNLDGSIDTTFNGGVQDLASYSDDIRSILPVAGGKTLVTGNFQAITRFNANGTKDSSFGSSGRIYYDATGEDYANEIAVDSKNRIITAGYYTPASNNTELIVMRRNSVGALDNLFATNGVFITAYGPTQDRASAVKIDANDNVVIAGYHENTSGDYNFIVVRLLGEEYIPPTPTPEPTTATPEPTPTTATPEPTPTTTTPEPTPTEPTTTPGTVELLTNRSFEIDVDKNKIPDGWSAKNVEVNKKDKLKCNKPEKEKYFARTGNCAFMFKGNPGGGNSKIQQKFNDFSSFTHGSTLTYSAWFDATNVSQGMKLANAVIKYSDGTKDKLTLLTPLFGGGTYYQRSQQVTINLSGRSIVKAKADLRFNGTSGKVLIDDVTLNISSIPYAIEAEDEIELLPLPSMGQ